MAGNFGRIQIATVTIYGNSLLRSYYLDPLTLYLNVVSVGQTQPSQNSPLPFLQKASIQDIDGHAGVYLFAFGNPSEQMQFSPEPGSQLILTPMDSTLFSRAVTEVDGWTLDYAPSDVTSYIVVRPVY